MVNHERQLEELKLLLDDECPRLRHRFMALDGESREVVLGFLASLTLRRAGYCFNCAEDRCDKCADRGYWWADQVERECRCRCHVQPADEWLPRHVGDALRDHPEALDLPPVWRMLQGLMLMERAREMAQEDGDADLVAETEQVRAEVKPWLDALDEWIYADADL